MKKKINISVFSVIVYWLVFLLLAGLFFTNDFGLVDIHKTSIITAVGIDTDQREVQVTAEIVVPQPSQSGENIKYTQVQGSGLTIADALTEINAKTGFYPKLQYCQLILIGESCLDSELFRILGCFYRKNYSELTALVAVCKGNAADMLAQKSDVSEMTSEAIRKILSDEIKKSANGTPANLKDIAIGEYSQNNACYLPYVEAYLPGTSENGGNGENVGGENPPQGGQSGNSGGGQSGSGSGEGGSSGGGSEGQSGGGQSGQSGSSGGEQPVEFTARKTAYFSNGKFKGVLNEKQSFALAVLKNEIRLAVLPCDADGKHYTIGIKTVTGGIDLKIKDGIPKVTLKFSGGAQIQGVRVVVDPNKIMSDDFVPESVLKSAEEEMEKRLSDLFETCKKENCDLLGLREMLYKHNTKYFEAFKNDIYQRAELELKVEIRSVN